MASNCSHSADPVEAVERLTECAQLCESNNYDITFSKDVGLALAANIRALITAYSEMKARAEGSFKAWQTAEEQRSKNLDVAIVDQNGEEAMTDQPIPALLDEGAVERLTSIVNRCSGQEWTYATDARISDLSVLLIELASMQVLRGQLAYVTKSNAKNWDGLQAAEARIAEVRSELLDFQNELAKRAEWLKREYLNGGNYEHLKAREDECRYILEKLRSRSLLTPKGGDHG